MATKTRSDRAAVKGKGQVPQTLRLPPVIGALKASQAAERLEAIGEQKRRDTAQAGYQKHKS